MKMINNHMSKRVASQGTISCSLAEGSCQHGLRPTLGIQGYDRRHHWYRGGGSCSFFIGSQRAILKKPKESKHWHLKTSYVSGFEPMSKIMVDGDVDGYVQQTWQVLGRYKTNMVFWGQHMWSARGFECRVDCCQQNDPYTFFVIGGKGSYILLLRRDWIHTNYCIPSRMH
jgi:hypothetical protein